MEIEVESFPCNRNTKTIDKVWTRSSTDGAYITVINDTITIDILILDITRLNSTKHLLRRVADIIIAGEKALCYETAYLINTIAALILVWIDTVLFIILANLVL